MADTVFPDVSNLYFKIRDDLILGFRLYLISSLKGIFLPALDASSVLLIDTEEKCILFVYYMG